ncbi:MAG: MMPL family transporter, partial [Methanomassiliicoccales archaeon]|nr:MMPL family transporter [Methanomassiliicoccales archaeon]
MVLIAWAVILIVSVPAILQVGDVITYETTGVTTGDYESVQASEIIKSEFQGTVANGSLIIVLQSNDVIDAASRDYVLLLQDKILSSHDMKNFTGLTSVYTINALVMDQAVLALGPTMRPTEQQVNSTAFLLWGVPALQLQNWAVSHSDAEAYNATSAQLASYLIQQGANQTQVQLTMGYYGAFAAAWNASGADPALLADPAARAGFSVNAVAPSFIAGLPVADAQKQVMMAVVNSFNLTSFNNPAAVHNFTLGMISQASAITDMVFLQGVYDLGPSYGQSAVDAYVSSVISNGTLATYPVQVPTQYLASLVSTGNRTMLLTLSFSVAGDYVTPDGARPMYDNVNVVRGLIGQVNSETGNAMTAHVTGDAAISADMMSGSMGDVALIEPITIIIIIMLMGILFRSVVAEFLPLGAVAVALGVSQALVFVIGSTVAQIDSITTTILFALLMGVGTDYSIFIVTRYREERIKGATREGAVHTSVTWAGESIVTSGLTVIIAFFAMALASFSFVQTMGLIMGMAIVVALMVALTLVPAILMLVGNRIFWPTTGERWKRFASNIVQKKREGNHGYFHQAASFGVKHAKVMVVVAILVSIPATYVYMTAEPSFDFIGAMGNSESIEGMNALSGDFGAGRIMPTQIVIVGDTSVYHNGEFDVVYLDAIENLTASIAADTSMVQQITGVTRPYGTLVDYRNISYMPEEQRSLLVNSMLQSVGGSNDTVLLTVVLKPEPQSNEAVSYISTLREKVADVRAAEPALAGSTILVGGSTASLYDLSTSISQQFSMIEIIVIVGIFIVLMFVLGSLLLPLFAVLSIAMSIIWAFTLTYLVFGTWLGV